jgi:hypothetical protein
MCVLLRCPARTGGLIAIPASRLRVSPHTLRWLVRRNRLIQIFILLFKIHEIGDVEKRVAFQPDIHKSRLHAWQHARHTAFINRSR